MPPSSPTSSRRCDAYGGSWASTLAKAAGLGVVYFVFFGAGMVALALDGVMTT